MMGHFSSIEKGMLRQFMWTCNTDLLFGPIVFFSAYSTDGSSLLPLSTEVGALFQICLKLCLLLGNIAANTNNVGGTGTMTNQSFHVLKMDAESRAV